MPVKLVPVSSSNVKAVGYEDGSLHVVFKNGDHYVYSDVDPDTYEELKTSSSVGSYLHKHIKGQHEHKQV